MWQYFKSAPEYSSFLALFLAPTLWLIKIEAPVAIEKQTDIVVQSGDIVFPKTAMYKVLACPKKMRSISIWTWFMMLLKISGTARASKRAK